MFTTLIEPNCIDLKQQQKVEVLAYVFTRIDDPTRRDMIRKMWASRSLYPTLHVIFPLGLSSNQFVNKLVQEEHNKFGDILQGDFLETYKNLTFKSIMSWQWMLKRCDLSLIQAVLKADDDVVINTPLLISDLSKKVKSMQFICRVGIEQLVYRDLVSYVDFPWRRNSYDTFCSGMWFVLSPDLVEPLYRTAEMNMGFQYDDVYVGMLASCIASVNFKHRDGVSNKDVVSGKSNASQYPAVYNLKDATQFEQVWKMIKPQ
jgi:hypothetical protein